MAPLQAHIFAGNKAVTCDVRGPSGGRDGSFGGEDESSIGRGAGVFLVWTTGTWGEQMFSRSKRFRGVVAVRQFVGFVGYYRRFVKDFAKLAEPLVALMRKGASFVWTDRQQTAFDALKACLLSAPILWVSHREWTFSIRHGRQPVCSRGEF